MDLGKEIEGFVPISQLGVEEELEDPSERFMEGDPLELKVIESDPINRRIVLAVTAIPERPERPIAEESEDVEAETGSEADVEVEAEAVEVEAEAEEVEAEAEEADATETEAVGEDGAGEVEEGVAESEEDSGTVEGDEEVEKEKDS